MSLEGLIGRITLENPEMECKAQPDGIDPQGRREQSDVKTNYLIIYDLTELIH